MAEFVRVERAHNTPTACYFCGGTEGPFVDTLMEQYTHGRVYICVRRPENPGCALQIGRVAGGLDPMQAETLRAALSEVEEVRDKLAERVDELEANRTISIAELEERGLIVRKPAGRPPKVPAES